ncbi:MAG: hypothetical protein NC389_18005 [Acetatifactor muris]|nr:hypothetical protein [Acetatifactor muris]
MSKKIGKAVFLAATIGSAVGATVYFLRKKDKAMVISDEEDYDFNGKAEESSDTSRSYVALNPETTEDSDAADTPSAEEESAFTPLTEQIAQTMENAEEHVEEFFDEEDTSDEETPVSDN